MSKLFDELPVIRPDDSVNYLQKAFNHLISIGLFEPSDMELMNEVNSFASSRLQTITGASLSLIALSFYFRKYDFIYTSYFVSFLNIPVLFQGFHTIRTRQKVFADLAEKYEVRTSSFLQTYDPIIMNSQFLSTNVRNAELAKYQFLLKNRMIENKRG